ncbi:16S rRNA (uracil(1498)-N(3))-methyltransferase [Actinomycetospora termitidis]|uniref:Ribosomal RNA small subunit methyltransferase E n=1 Tax=Actinomycetospora termitidis TaxID=3053470 RepID=A0ABT7MF94_9PSEU|nr:16S rRNA (uracil(1498)-N(3))-methyltransferase [Actinomycetospora sp. Odt1-22]MDL5159345.1 16S rRNA (uracil(1498)-N(3))-methyltransferase [Actinomycetospora sp. Odt1-22]
MSRADWTRPALFRVDPFPTSGVVQLDGPEGRHAADVRRVQPGEVILLGDGAGTRARAEVTAVAKGRVTAEVLETRTDPPSGRPLVLAQALAKGDRGELAVETATEAGIDAVIPWRAERCVTRWDDGPRGAKQLGRWRSTVTEAAKQARRAWNPEVTEPMTTNQLARRIRSTTCLLLEATAEVSMADVALGDQGEIVLLVGPEGGVTDGETATLVDAGALPVRLGPDVLRTSTAAVVALGALGVRTGRWEV